MTMRINRVARRFLVVTIWTTVMVTGSVAGLDDGLVAYWPLDFCGDDIQGGHHLSLLGNPQFGLGDHRGAIQLNGTTQYAQADGYVYSEFPMTVSCRVYLDPSWSGPRYVIANLDHVAEPRGWALAIGGDPGERKIRFWLGNGIWEMTGPALSTGTWHDVVITVDATPNAIMYVDCVPSPPVAFPESAPPQDPAVKFTVGARWSGELHFVVHPGFPG